MTNQTEYKIQHRNGKTKKFKSLIRADLSNCIVHGDDLKGADLSRADLSYTDLSKAVLVNTDLTKANLTKANLTGANLTEANLKKADLEYCDLSEVDLQFSKLNGVKGNGKELISVKIDEYTIVLYKDIVCVGCKTLTREKFLTLKTLEVKRALGEYEYEYYKNNKNAIKKLFKVFPIK